MKKIEEKKGFEFFKFDEVPVIDSNHAVEQFISRHENLKWSDFFTLVRRGLVAIKNDFDLKQDHYMIISHRLGLRVPLQVGKNKITIPTVLKADQVRNRFNDLEIMVEKNIYQREQLCEGFNIYLDDDRIFIDYNEIIID